MNLPTQTNKNKLPLQFENFDSYDLSDCTILLQQLDKSENAEDRIKAPFHYSNNIDSQLNYTLLF